MNIYQFIILEPGLGGFGTTLKSTIERCVSDLGLNPKTDVSFHDETNMNKLNKKFPAVGAYFGGTATEQTITDAVKQMVNDKHFLLPIVADLEKYKNLVPTELWPINGMVLPANDPGLNKIAMRLLEEMHLVRNKRGAFISYVRKESKALALQLYQALDERQYDVFLDTHSIEPGKPFQNYLWDRMADVDLIILIDTPGAYKSKWVQEEIRTANRMGFGILQLVWPGHKPTQEINFGEIEQLQCSDFEKIPPGKIPDKESSLESNSLDKVMARIEAVRARSISARRTRIVDELTRETRAQGINLHLQPTSHLVLQNKKGESIAVFPSIGHPCCEMVQACEKTLADDPNFKTQRDMILYDADGMLDRRRKHLSWLNRKIPSLQTVSTEEVDEWMKAL